MDRTEHREKASNGMFSCTSKYSGKSGSERSEGGGGGETIDDIPFALPIANHSMFEHSMLRYIEESWSKFVNFVLLLMKLCSRKNSLRDGILAMSPPSVRGSKVRALS